MFSKRVALLLLLLGTGLGALFSQTRKSESGRNLKLLAHRSGGPIAEANGSFLYIGELSNEGAAAVNVEAVQMPGGYAGSGKFFACSLQTWDNGEQRWALQRFARLSNYGKNPNVTTLEVRPGMREEVCRMVLPAQSGKNGACARFLFRLKWQDTGGAVMSNPFIIGSSSSSESNPCRVRGSSAMSTILHEPGHVLVAAKP